MAVLKIESFGGIIPVKGDRALPNNFAVESVNTWLYGQELRGIRPPEHIIDILASTRKVLRVPKRTIGGDPAHPGVVPPPSYLGDSTWVQFQDPDTDIVKGALVRDQYERYYFCSPTTGPVFNTYQRLQQGLAMLKLGVVGPDTTYDATKTPPNDWTPIVTSVTGGDPNITTTRNYCYTWVNEYGEESAPSLPILFSGGAASGIWHIANIRDPVAQDGYPAYTKKYLYRSITAASGATSFYRVDTIPLGTTTYDDDTSKMTDSILVGNLPLESTTWALPPASLKGFIAMPNGFLIGFDKNTIYMSEAYHWHAWPAEYEQATETPIVGLGVIGQTCVVCTEGYPTTVTGSSPAACSFTKATTGEPCYSRGSIVSTPQGVTYASQNGLIQIGPSGINNITEALITREEWVRYYAPQFLRAVRYQNGYLALMATEPTATAAFYIDPTKLEVALTLLSDVIEQNMVNFNVDFWSGEVFLLMGAGEIRRWDAPSDEMMPVKWVSKEFQYQFQENFGAYAVYWDDARYSTINWGNNVLPANEKIRLRVYADRRKVYDHVVPANGRPLRLPSGFKADIWQFEIASRAPVYSLHIASTMKELRTV